MDSSVVIQARLKLAQNIQGIPNAKIKRAFWCLDELLASVGALRQATDPKASQPPSAIGSAIDQLNRGTMETATAHLKGIRYHGEAAEITARYKELAQAKRKIAFSSYQAAYDAMPDKGDLADAATLVFGHAVELELALLKVEAVLCSDARKLLKNQKAGSGRNRPHNRGKKTDKTKQIEKLIRAKHSNNEIDHLVPNTNPGAISMIRYRMKASKSKKDNTP